MSTFFEIESPKDLFDIAEQRYTTYHAAYIKSAEDLMFIIMVLNHLREWIAPGYNPTNHKWLPADTPAKDFSRRIYELPSFSTIRHLCNGSKHAKKQATNTVPEYEQNIFAWPDFFAVKDIFKGALTAHTVDGKTVDDFIMPVMAAYRSWFYPA